MNDNNRVLMDFYIALMDIEQLTTENKKISSEIKKLSRHEQLIIRQKLIKLLNVFENELEPLHAAH